MEITKETQVEALGAAAEINNILCMMAVAEAEEQELEGCFLARLFSFDPKLIREILAN